ncbi:MULTISPECIES: carbon starvation CstA family protein [Nocardia]|uniref:carbon starvation CstA family protein n=1 Tax=Nocardia TaxID=1817 RepID=UPI0007EA3894|nr:MULTISPECIES: carbon starvation CstA family protein [Nocardia]MBF6277141.1 carbon starvation protein A [Nocardia nova]OBA54784.1 carbon starvation protein CstA [Nocardia sp. 852002-51101_SCH5132738]OBB51989.1 carbon starvation protein CstA [Nocardia sp. 852002-51244_SCH5132740]OBF72479.1 carbon starvation protein CstA [Mycobacterium sp. 852002-51759_SCH5129042]
MATIEYLRTEPDLPPVGIVDRRPITPAKKAIFAAVAVFGAVAWAILAVARGEDVNAVWIVIAAVCTYIIAYQFYARLIEWKITTPRDDTATPAEELENGTDYMPMDRRVLFGHHFAAIAGAGPLVGPVLAAQMGYLPGTLWIVIGVVLAGAVQDYLVLWASVKRRGRSLGQMARDELGVVGGIAALIAVLVIMVILLAVLGIVVVNALAATKGADGQLHGGSPWGVFSISMTIPIALLMGLYLRYVRPGKVGEISVVGFALLLLAIVSGRWVSESGWGRDVFTLSGSTIAWMLIIYGFIASVLPVWLLLAPRDYLSTFMKVGTIVLLALGVVITMPVLHAPAVSQFAGNSKGPAFAGSLFPFLFITIACGALSGFHALVSSGTTPKLLEKQSQARMIGYGGMLMESFVAVMAIIAASILDQHLYFAMNTGGLTSAQAAADKVNALGLGGTPITANELNQAAHDVGEQAIYSRTGGAPTLAVGMAEVMHNFIGGAAMKSFWYHFAIMFEALFILTTIDAGTRVARFMLSDTLGNLGGPARKFKDPSWRPGAWLCTFVVVTAWGSVLLMGVTDPLGGIYTLYPLFGIANQLLAAVALTVVLVIVMKKRLWKWAWIPALPLIWDLIVTMTASWQKIFSGDKNIGYWTQHRIYSDARDAGKVLAPAKSMADMDKVVRNTFIQGSLSIIFAVLVLIVAAVGVIVCVQAVRRGGGATTETPEVPSKIFGPSGFVTTKTEKEVQREWAEYERSGAAKVPGAAAAATPEPAS